MATDYLDLTTQANALPTLIASKVLGALKSNMALLAVVNRDYSQDLAEKGQTVQVPIRGALTAYDKSEGGDVTVNAPTATKKDVSLDTHKEVTFGEEDVSIMMSDMDSIGGYTRDGAIALLTEIEDDLAGLYSGFSQTLDATGGLGEDDFREARRQLNSALVPPSGRWAVVHEDAEFEVLGIERIINRDYADSLGSAVMSARYSGTFAGFNIFMDQNIAVASSECKNLFGHADGLTLATRPMRKTKLQTVSQAIMNEDGIGIRVTHWYNANALAEQVTLDILYGVAELRDNHVVVVSTAEI